MGSRLRAYLPLLVGIAAATFLNEGFSLLRAGDGLERVAALLQYVSATAFAMAAIGAAAWLALCEPAHRLFGLPREPLAWSAAAGIVGFAALQPFAAMIDGAPAVGLSTLAVLAGVAAGALGGLASRRRGGADLLTLAALWTICLGPPALALIWLVAVHRPAQDRFPRVVVWAACAGAGLLLFFIGRALRRSISAGGPVAALVSMLLLVGPVARAVGAGAPHVTPADGPTGRPSLLLITIDTLRADHVGAHGAEGDLTPSIDRLAEHSLVFHNARSPSPWTKPAMASMLTGLPPAVHSMLGRTTRLPREIETVAARLAQEGYTTVAVGRNGYLSRRFGFDRGFRHFEITAGSEPRPHPSLGAGLVRMLGWTQHPPSTDELASRAIDWLEALRQAQPFFLWIHFFDPHLPYEPPGRYLPSGDDTEMASFAGHMSFRSGHLKLSEEERESVRRLYRGEVRYVDDAVGRILDELERSGLYERVGIVLTSDHGEELFEHGGIEHGHTLYDEVLRVPLVVKPPGRLPRVDLEHDVSTESVAQTLIDLAGSAARPLDFSTMSLLRVASGEMPPPVISSALLYYDDMSGVVFDGIKYVRRERDGWERIFMLGDDPDERNGVSDPALLANARELLDGYHASALRARAGLGLDQTIELQLDEKELEDLRALGYVR